MTLSAVEFAKVSVVKKLIHLCLQVREPIGEIKNLIAGRHFLTFSYSFAIYSQQTS